MQNITLAKQMNPKPQTTAWRKEAIRNWLDRKGLQYDQKVTIPILFSISKRNVIKKEYVLEKLTRDFCNETGSEIQILRLPVGHSDLNPIELIRANVKNHVARKIKIKDVNELVLNALASVTPQHWKDTINHVIKVEDEFIKIDSADECPIVESIIINIGDTSDENSSSDTDSNTDVEFDE